MILILFLYIIKIWENCQKGLNCELIDTETGDRNWAYADDFAEDTEEPDELLRDLLMEQCEQMWKENTNERTYWPYPCRTERVAKYNRLLLIENEIFFITSKSSKGYLKLALLKEISLNLIHQMQQITMLQ